MKKSHKLVKMIVNLSNKKWQTNEKRHKLVKKFLKSHKLVKKKSQNNQWGNTNLRKKSQKVPN